MFFSKYRHPFPRYEQWQERFYNLRKVAVCCSELELNREWQGSKNDTLLTVPEHTLYLKVYNIFC